MLQSIESKCLKIKTLSQVFGFALLLPFGATPALANEKKFEAGEYQMDMSHSLIGFEIDHLVISSVDGKFLKGTADIKLNKNFTQSEVKAKIEIASLDTGVKDRDDHLKSPDFFDAIQFPLMTFNSTTIKGTPLSFEITGKLKIKNIEKNITFKGQFLGQVKDLYGQNKVAFNLSTEINRKEFGLNWSKLVEAGPVVGDKVKINLKIQAIKKL